MWKHAWIFHNLSKPSISYVDPSFTFWSFKEQEEVNAMHDWVFHNVGLVVHKHELIKGSQESCGLRAISIVLVWVNTLKLLCLFFFVIILGKVPKGEGVISSTARSARRFVACCLWRSYGKRSKGIFILRCVIVVIIAAARVVKWSRGSLLCLFYSQCHCSCYFFCKWRQSLWFRWSFSTRWWSSWFSTLFKKDEVDSRERVVLESKFASSQLKAFKFILSDAYFKPYAIDVADRYQCIVKPCVVTCIRCSGILASKQVLYVLSKFSRYAVFWFRNHVEWTLEISQCFGGNVIVFG